MADVENVMGPAGSPDFIRRNERSTADADKFKEEMMRKMAQVNEADPEQQKKRKQQAEEEEEEAVPEPEPTPPSQVTPFDLQKQVNPMDLEGGGKTSPLSSAQQTEAAPQPQTSSFMAAAPEGTQPDFEDASSASIFNVPEQAEAEPQTSYQQQPAPQAPQEAPQAPAPQPAAQPQISPQGPAQPAEQPAVQQQQQMQQATSAQTTQQQQQQQQQQQSQTDSEGTGTLTRKPLLAAPKGEAGPKTSSEEGGPEPMQPQEEIGKPSSSEMLQKGMTGQDLEKTELGSKEETSGLFEQMTQQGAPDKPITAQKKAEELAATDAEGLVTPTPVLTPTEGSFEGDQGHKKKEEELSASTSDLSMPTPQLIIQPDMPVAESTPPPAYTAMNSYVLDLFERMVGVMTIMTDSKMTETVITLNAPQFASSVFYGTQIIIQEYASAPKAFNVQLNGNPEAVALFQGNADDLMAAFQYGNYNFRINRLETGYLSERPLFHRKEKASGDKQDQTGPGP
ncbi:MAG: hypothetical protein JSR57_02140 [Verrucomicrobia bacterium]|nr:hypothetical protein [Verrucomicrobiota bacterium]